MKSKLQLLCISVILCFIGTVFVLWGNDNKVRMKFMDGEMILVLNDSRDGMMIRSWENEQDGKKYFFLPSFVKQNEISFDISENESIEIDKIDIQKKGETVRKLRQSNKLQL